MELNRKFFASLSCRRFCAKRRKFLDALAPRRAVKARKNFLLQ